MAKSLDIRGAATSAESELATLAAREERIRLALAAGRIHTWEWDVSRGGLVWPESLARELCIAAAPADFEAFQRLVHPDDADYVANRVNAALRGPDDYSAEFRMIRGDGSIRWCSARAIVVRDAGGRAVRMVGVDQDVTEKHELLRRTGESEARLRLALEAAGAGTWEYCLDRGELFASDRALALYGLSGGAAITPEMALSALDADDRARVETALCETLGGGAPFRVELRLSGSNRWLLTQAELRAEGGRRRLIGVVEDITDRKAAEAALRRNEERFRVALGSSPTAVFEQDVDLRYTWIHNPKLGYAAEAVIGKTDAELMDPSCAPALEAIKRRVMATGAPERHAVAASAPGAELEFFDLHVEPRRDAAGRMRGVLCVATDITDRKRAEEALRDSEARYRAAMTVGRMGSWETNYLTRTRHWTPESQALFGLDLADGVGRVGGDEDEFWSALHPADRHLYQHYRETEDQQDTFVAEYRIVRPDGRTRWMSGHGGVIDRFPDGRALRMVNVATDITERKLMEQETSFLLHEVAHRSRNLLAVVHAIAESTARRASDLDAFRETFLDRLRGLAASNDLLIASRRAGAPLDELVRRQLAPFVELSSGRVTVEGPSTALSPDAAQSIGLALHELATNAVKHGALSTPDGAIRVAWRFEPGADGPALRIDWAETGGPPVAEPTRKGFGQAVIKTMIENALSASARIDFAPAGVRWSLTAPLSAVLAAGGDRAAP